MTRETVHGGDIYTYEGVLDFSSNMNPLGTPESVRRAAAESLLHIQEYPDTDCRKLKKALAEAFGISADDFFIGNGAAEVVFALVQALRPRLALLQAPTFAEYEQALKTVDCRIARYSSKKHDFRVEEDFLQALTPETDLVFLCNPNNPTGFTLKPSLLEEIVRVCRERNIFLVVDECFLDFLPDGEERSLVPALVGNEGILLLKAFTKKYAMAGLRLGYGISSNHRLLERMNRMVQPWNVSLPAQAAGLAALQETEYAARGCRLAASERRRMMERMASFGLRVYPSEANYIFFSGPVGLKEYCLGEGLLIRSCANYPDLDETYYRVAVKAPEENDRLLKALEHSGKFMKKEKERFPGETGNCDKDSEE